MANNDSASYVTRFNSDTQILEYAVGSFWVPVPGVGGGITQLTGAVLAGPGSGSQAASLVSTFVTAALLTGYVSGAGTITTADSILTAIDKLNGNQSLYLPLTGGTVTGTTTFNKAIVSPVGVLGNGTGTGTQTPDATQGPILSTTVTGNMTINGPTGGFDGQKIILRLTQDSTGHTVTFAAGGGNFVFGTDIPSFTASGASLTDYVGIIFRSGTGVWNVVAVSHGF